MPRSFACAALAPTALALALAAPAAATAAMRCPAPESGYRACLNATWSVDDHGAASAVTARVTLLHRVARCAPHGARRVSVWRGDARLHRERATARCSHGVVRWSTRITRDESRDWTLHAGDALRTSWGGTSAAAQVRLRRPGRR
jgi:hypothetical protein